MFMNDFHVEQNVTGEFYMDETMASEVANESNALEDLLNTVDAARAGLASDEHEFDILEEETH